MNPLLQILEYVLTDKLAKKKSTFLQYSAIGVTIFALTIALSFIALMFLALALHNWLLLYLMPAMAALATAGVLLLLCLIILLVTYLALTSRKEPTHTTEDLSEKATAMASEVAKELESSIGDSPKTTLLLAGIAGLIAGRYLK